MRLSLILIPVALLLVVAAAQAQEQKTRSTIADNKNADNNVGKASVKASGKTPAEQAAQEAVALAFVDKNHPELAGMLPQLKKRHPREYQAAIRELANSQQRLAKLADRDRTAYGIELKLWQIDSRVRLLAAQIGMGADREKLSGEIRTALAERAALELRRKQLQRELLQSRLEKVDSEIARMQSRREERVESDLAKILSSVDRSGKSAESRGPIKPNKSESPVKPNKPGKSGKSANPAPVNSAQDPA